MEGSDGCSMAAGLVNTVRPVHISSVIPNLFMHLSRLCPHVKFINVPVGCNEGR